MKTIWRCKECDSPDVLKLEWKHLNDEETSFDPIASGDWADYYCNSCGHTRVYEDTDQPQRPDKVNETN